MNHHMNKLDSTLSELLNMLKTVEGVFKKRSTVPLLQSSKMSKKKDKKNKSDVSKVNKPIRGIKKDKDICYYCGKEEH